VIERYAIDRSVRRPTPEVLLGGSPLRVFRLALGGVRVVDALERGEHLPAGHASLTDRLLDAGVIHRVVDGSCDPDMLTVVTPVLDDTPRFRSRQCRSLVVDDGSAVPVVDSAVRHHRPQGPGAARNSGLGLVDTPFVAFVDADVEVDDETLLGLAAHLDADPRCALAAPRILAAGGTSVLERFELGRSPLDLGAEPARIAPATRVSYVPAAVIVCRTEAMRSIGGFDTTLRFGEDVDLVWRLVAAGWRGRYDPAFTARHTTRPTLRAWLAQRHQYGTSAAPLEARHPGALTPVRMSGWSWLAWSGPLTGTLAGVVGGALVTAATSAALVRKLPNVPTRVSADLAARGTWSAGRLLASASWRAWWPVTVSAALLSRRARRLALVALGVNIWSNRRTTALDPVRHHALCLADDLAYGSGVWRGALRQRRVDALLPRATRWPPR
jgi:mycofactocin glycosyltransferase